MTKIKTLLFGIETDEKTGETKLAGCLKTRANGSSRCSECSKKYNENK